MCVCVSASIFTLYNEITQTLHLKLRLRQTHIQTQSSSQSCPAPNSLSAHTTITWMPRVYSVRTPR